MFAQAMRRNEGSGCQRTFCATAVITSDGGKPSAQSATTPMTMEIAAARIGGRSGRQGQLRGGGSGGEGLGMIWRSEDMGCAHAGQGMCATAVSAVLVPNSRAQVCTWALETAEKNSF